MHSRLLARDIGLAQPAPGFKPMRPKVGYLAALSALYVLAAAAPTVFKSAPRSIWRTSRPTAAIKRIILHNGPPLALLHLEGEAII